MTSGKVSPALRRALLVAALPALGCFSTTDPMHAATAGGHGTAGSGGTSASMHPNGTGGSRSASGGSASTKGSGGSRVSTSVDPDHPGTGGKGGSPASFDGGVATPTGTGGQTGGDNSGICDRGGLCQRIRYEVRDKLDLLFLIDNSDSMGEEQERLRMQFPRMIDVLTSGDLDGDGKPENTPAQSIHLGIVTSDMGLPGVQGISNCQGLGQDGLLQSKPSALVADCNTSYPPFLTYEANVPSASSLAKDFQCIASVGTGGCGFEQPLEAVLKALWPSVDPLATHGQNRILFLPNPVTGKGQLGHGDIENAGFLRNDPAEGQSVIALVVLSDEDDCSMNDTRPFTPPQFLDPADPLASEGMNLRCHFNAQALYPIERYVNGLRALRPGREDLVVFATIAGVPADLVDPNLHSTDFDGQAARDAFYSAILSDARMQPVVDDLGTPDPTDDKLQHSCNGSNGATADPPRRLVETAKGFGANGIVQSICSDDFTPAMNAITARIGSHLGADCLPRELARNSDGLVACDLLWELPLRRDAPPGTPTGCGALPFLHNRSHGPTTSASGGAICEVAQLPVMQIANGEYHYGYTDFYGTTVSTGWMYDDVSKGTSMLCVHGIPARVAFTNDVELPLGVTMVLDCAQ